MITPDSYSAIGWLIVALAATATATNQIKQAMRRPEDEDRAKITNDPLNVRVRPEWATHQEVENLRVEVRALAHQMAALPQEMAHASEERLQRVHERIDLLTASMASMPDRLVALLANSGALHKK